MGRDVEELVTEYRVPFVLWLGIRDWEIGWLSYAALLAYCLAVDAMLRDPDTEEVE